MQLYEEEYLFIYLRVGGIVT